MSNSDAWSISADWVIPADGSCLRNGAVRVRGETIEALGPAGEVTPAKNHRHIENAAILPGLVNAHTHLELSHLRGELPPHRPMTQWLFGVFRRMPHDLQIDSAVSDGAKEAIETGTTTIADICHNNRSWQTLKQNPLRKVCFAEVTGIGPAAKGAAGRLERSIEDVEPDERLSFGLTPHAPYSTSEEIYLQTVEMARKRGWLLSTHLAETQEEREFMLEGSGKFFDFLGHLGLLSSSLAVHKCKPVEFARRVGLLEAGAILVHCNYIDDDELKLLADSPVSVVYCPRSSDFFARTGHRYGQMLEMGINVAMGTDSLASNSSLDMLEEMRRIRKDSLVDNQTILEMATINGAIALRMDCQIGSLAPDKFADFITVEISPDTKDPLEEILTGDGKITETFIAGKSVL